MNWTEAEYREYKSRVQLPIGRGVSGLDKPRRITSCRQEWEEAEALTRWTTGEGLLKYPELKWLYHVPNGGWRSPKVANALKRQGVKPGPPDYNLDIPRGIYHGLRIELKRRKGGSLSDYQREWILWLLSQGYCAVVCRGWEEARGVLISYLTEVYDGILDCTPPAGA